MIIFKWYSDEKNDSKKETDFEAENEDLMSIIASIAGYIEHSGFAIDKTLDLDDSKKENIKGLIIAACKTGIRRAFEEE